MVVQGLYRQGESHWTRGAYLRGSRAQQFRRPEKQHYTLAPRKKYVLARLSDGKIAFARSSDRIMSPSPIDLIERRAKTSPCGAFWPEALLTGSTEKGRRLLRDNHWQIEEVPAKEIVPAFRPPQRSPFRPMPETEVNASLKTFREVVMGRYIPEGEIDIRFKGRHVINVALTEHGLSCSLLAPSARLKMPHLIHLETIYEKLPEMHSLFRGANLSFTVARPLILDENDLETVKLLLRNLPSVIFRLQQMVATMQNDACVRLDDVVILARASDRQHRMASMEIIPLSFMEDAGIVSIIDAEQLTSYTDLEKGDLTVSSRLTRPSKGHSRRPQLSLVK